MSEKTQESPMEKAFRLLQQPGLCPAEKRRILRNLDEELRQKRLELLKSLQPLKDEKNRLREEIRRRFPDIEQTFKEELQRKPPYWMQTKIKIEKKKG